MMSRIRQWLSGGSSQRTSVEPPVDFYAVGYPKTGNTWLRIMMGRYVQLVHGTSEMPLFDKKEMLELRANGHQGKTGEFTHFPLSWSSQQAGDLSYEATIRPFLDTHILLLVRHPLDTIVSSFMHFKHKTIPAYEGSLLDFVADPVHGLDKLFKFYELWAAHSNDVKDVLLVRYEDTHADPAGQLRRVLSFVSERIDEAAINEAVGYASFDNLKQLETAGARLVYKSSGFNAFGDGARDDPNAFHVRKGLVEGYRTELPAELIPGLEARVRREMPAFYGYS